MATEAATYEENGDIFALDKWLRNFGLWFRNPIEENDPEKRSATLSKLNLTEPYILTSSGYDPESQQFIHVRSETSYDDETGVLNDKITYWYDMPFCDNDNWQQSENHVLQIRAVREPDLESENGAPVLLPEQVIFNGAPVFQGYLTGGQQNPFRPEERRLIDRMIELSQLAKEHMINKEPAEDFAKIFAGGNLPDNISKLVTGSAAPFRGLSENGGYEETLTPYILDVLDEKPFLKVPDLEYLKNVLGYYLNTVEADRSLTETWHKSATDQSSGVRYLTGTEYDFDEKTGRHNFRIFVRPENPPQDTDISKGYDLFHLSFSEGEDGGFRLENAALAGQGMTAGKDLRNTLGAYQRSLRYLSDRKYPPYRSILAHHELWDKFSELDAPPSYKEGGETLWIPLNGLSKKKKWDNFGDAIGGGNMIMQRVSYDDGRISEVAVLQGFPLAIGGADSDWDGMNIDIWPWRDAVRQGVIVLDHDHFDHASIEYYAKQVDENGNGWFKGQKVLCNERVADIVISRLNKLEVPRTQWPEFIMYDKEDALNEYEDLHRINEHEYAYCVKDEEGNARHWVQVCKNGTTHSALTDSHIITGCYNDKIQDSYYVYNDAFGLNKHGWDFAERGQFGLVGLPGVTEEALDAAIPDRDHKYIAFHDPTGITNDGHSPRPEVFKNTFRACLKFFRDEAIIHVPFSTNHLEIQAVHEVCSEEETLRNTTFVGANAEIRGTVMNKHGVDPELDLRNTVIPADKIPQLAYDAVIEAIDRFIATRTEQARKKQEKRGGNVESYLGEDYLYLVFKHLYDKIHIELDAGKEKPDTIYEKFFSGKEGVFDETADELGLEPGVRERKMPNVIQKSLDDAKKKRATDVKDQEADTAYWMLRSLAKNRKVKFKDRCNHNEYAMYQAIMAGQETARRHATRTSNIAKTFRDRLGRLLVTSTGPTGSAEEQMASLSRFARGESLFDYDSLSRKTGYKLDAEKTVLFVTQPAPPGTGTALAQEALMKEVVANRNVTIFCAHKNGFKVYNPKEKRAEMERSFRDQGWNYRYDGANDMIIVEDQPLHIHGHGFWQDVWDMVHGHTDEDGTFRKLRAKTHEFIHIPTGEHFNVGRNLIQKAGEKTSIEEPDDHRAHKYVVDQKTGEGGMKITNWLTPSAWLFQVRRRYGQQYGGIVNMVRFITQCSEGNKRSDGLDVREDLDNFYGRNTANRLYNAFLKAINTVGARQSVMGPSPAEIQPAGGRPRGCTASSLVSDQMRAALKPS